MPARPKLVQLVCNKNKLMSEVNELCKLVERVSEIDYKSKTQSVISVCDRGTGNEQLNYPYGVTVDHNTGNIYVADNWNNCIKVFNNTARYLFKFGNGNEELTKRKIELERLSHQNQGQLSISAKPVQNKILKIIDEELKAIVMPARPKLVQLVCNKNKLMSEVNELCKLVERVSEIDYKSKTQSVISVCDRGTGNEQLNYPYGVTVDHNTGNIYVADNWNNCIKVFNNTARYLFKFGNGNEEGKMSYPSGLLIRGNKVFVSHNHCILVYQLDGKFVSSIGSRGSVEVQFNYPRGLSTDEYNNDIYICDRNNHRIQIISENLQFKSQFGKDTLRYPRDIEHYKDNIFILDQSNPCVHIYNKDLVLQRSVVTRGRGQQFSNPYFFFIDNFGNILITDRSSDSILILNSEFEFIHKISVSQPTGITMDRDDRIIVTSYASHNCLQLF